MSIVRLRAQRRGVRAASSSGIGIGAVRVDLDEDQQAWFEIMQRALGVLTNPSAEGASNLLAPRVGRRGDPMWRQLSE